ncbi:MAG: J domain-containing protein [Lachnospiraceae bacterium]|nr:J domain-containing protein [Lachnospiraceae bacterium]
MAQAVMVTEENRDDFRKWCFHETVRIERDKQELKEEMTRFEEEKKAFYDEKVTYESQKRLERVKFENENHVFEMKLKILEDELRRMAAEREELRKEREYTAQKVAEAKNSGEFVFFAGVYTEDALKKRYKNLMKIYHPDNLDGDEDTLLAIQEEYERISKML